MNIIRNIRGWLWRRSGKVAQYDVVSEYPAPLAAVIAGPMTFREWAGWAYGHEWTPDDLDDYRTGIQTYGFDLDDEVPPQMFDVLRRNF